MQVEVHDVDAEVAGARLGDEGVHVGSVHVEQAALAVEDFGDAGDLFVEDSEGVGIGEHEARDLVVHLRFQGGQIDHAAAIAAQVFDLVADHGGGGGIGAVGGVRDQHLLARVALGFQIGAHEQDSGEFAVGSGGGLEGDGIHAGDFDELIGERLHDAQRALGVLLGLIGMGSGNSVEARDDLVDARIVLHGAGAERIHAVIDGVVPGGKAGEVADDFNFADFRERSGRGAQSGAEFGGGDRLRARRAGAGDRLFCRARSARR